MWVVVINIVNPSHFYVQYLAEATEIMTLSKKISYFCSTKNSCFTSKDDVETGTPVLFFFTHYNMANTNSKRKWRDFRWLKCTLKACLCSVSATSNNLSAVLFVHASGITPRRAALFSFTWLSLLSFRLNDFCEVETGPVGQGQNYWALSEGFYKGCQMLSSWPARKCPSLLYWLWHHRDYQHSEGDRDGHWVNSWLKMEGFQTLSMDQKD